MLTVVPQQPRSRDEQCCVESVVLLSGTAGASPSLVGTARFTWAILTRSWLRIAAALIAALLVLVAFLLAGGLIEEDCTSARAGSSRPTVAGGLAQLMVVFAVVGLRRASGTLVRTRRVGRQADPLVGAPV